MKPGQSPGDALHRAARWTGWPLQPDQHQRLMEYASWLLREGIPGGALGPNEADRILDRHLADSLLFAAGWDHPTPPDRLADLGSGAGLPGIPLAVLWPETRVHLVERKGRRMDLLRRAARLLSLENVSLEAGDADRLELNVEMVVVRAVGPLHKVREWVGRYLIPGGVAVVGGSWIERPHPRPGEAVREVPAEVLDRPVWLRIMAAP